MIIIKKLNSVVIITLLLFAGYFFVNLTSNIQAENLMLACKIVSFVGIIDFILLIVSYYKRNKKRDYIFMILFLTSFFLFSFGEHIVYLIWPKHSRFFDSFYATLFNNNFYYVLKSGLFTLISMNCLYLGTLFKKKNNLYRYNNYEFANFARTILIIVSIPVFLFKMKQFSIAFYFGYDNARLLQIPAMINICESLFIGALFTLSYYSKYHIFYSIVLLLYSFITIIIGNRTIGMSMFVVLILICILKKKKLILNIKNIILLGFVGYILISIIVTISDFRLVENKNIVLLFDAVFNSMISGDAIRKFLSELGFTSFSLISTMNYMEGHLYGLSYIGSIVSFIPSSLDFLHILDIFEKYIYLDEWLTQMMGITFGSGYSLVSEAYLNFNIFGSIVFLFVGHFIDRVYINVDNNLFSIYKKLVLTFILFTLPRRTSVYFIDNYLYCILIPNLAMYFLYVNKIHLRFRKRGIACQKKI